jgi:predicted Zn-dependent protease
MKDQIKQISDFVRKNCQADDFTLRVDDHSNLYTRFAQNAITQHIDGNNLEMQLEVAFDNKTGTASANQYDEESLKDLIKKAENIARLNKPDPEFIPSEGAHHLRKIVEPSQQTTKLKVEEIVDGIDKCIKNALAKDAKVSGISERNITANYMLTGNGFEGYDQKATFAHSMTLKKGGIETKVSCSINDYAKFSMDKMIDQLNSQFNSLKEPQPIDKGRIPVIMRPQAVLQMILYLVWMYQLREADEGINTYTNQLGKGFFGKEFTLRSTTGNPSIHAPLFTNNGLPTKDIDWVVNGVIKNLQSDRYYAAKKGIEPCTAYNFAVEGDSVNEQEMMNRVERGLILNNLWYIRPIDVKKGEWTGLTRDGVLYFADGKIQNAVYNLRWNEVFHDVTKRILALGPVDYIESYAAVPTMLIDDFNFVDVTTF